VSGPAAGVNASSQSGAQGCHCPAGQAQGAAAAARWPGAGQATNLASALRCGRRRLAATAPPACLQDAVAPRPAATPATPARCPSYPSLATVLRLLLSAGPPALQHWLLTAVSVGPVWPICRSALQTLNCCSQRTSCAPRGYCGRRISKHVGFWIEHNLQHGRAHCRCYRGPKKGRSRHMRRSFQNSIDFGKATASPTYVLVPGPKSDSVQITSRALF
jgi:hypothetical protein